MRENANKSWIIYQAIDRKSKWVMKDWKLDNDRNSSRSWNTRCLAVDESLDRSCGDKMLSKGGNLGRSKMIECFTSVEASKE